VLRSKESPRIFYAMRIKAISALVGAYSGESLYLRKKSRILAWMGLGFGLISLAFAVLMGVTGALVPAAVFVGISLFCALVLGLLRAGKYSLSTSIFLYGLFVAMFVAIKFDAYVDVYETYVFGTLGCFLLLVSTLVANRPGQAIICGALSLGAVHALYWLDAFPADGGTVSTLAVQNLAMSSLLVILGTVVAAFLVRMTGGLLAEVQVEAEVAEHHYADLNAAMDKAQASSLAIGQSLASSVVKTAKSIETLRSRVDGIVKGMDELDEALGRSGDANQRAEESQNRVRSALTAYAEQVTIASAAVEQMAATAKSLADQASGKQEAVGALVASSRQGENVIASMGQSMAELQEAARRVMELSAIIGDVADRTNLLGMNASIEAAHAGAAGKGFAVVANEIRSLSVETAKSARVIAETLAQSQSIIAATAAKSGEALASYRRIGEDIRGVSALIEEFLASVKELSAGSEEIVIAVNTVSELTRSTETAVEGSQAGMSESLAGMDAVAEIASRVRTDTATMSESFDEMRHESDDVRRLGDQNLGTIQALRSSLAGFTKATKAGGKAAPAATPERRP